MLATTIHGDSRADVRPLLIAHGLFGSARNWGVVSRHLSQDRQVIAVDMRNHGQSPWSDSNTYFDLADDLAEVIESHGGVADVLGHSMGGKAVMTLALTHPAMVERMIVADIAPVQYAHTQKHYIDVMEALDLSSIPSRTEADRRMRVSVPELATRAFLLQSLDLQEKRWRLNLGALAAEMPHIMGFPQINATFDKPTLYVSGGLSDYVRPEHRQIIKSLFPSSRLIKIPGANHWLHAEKPREFEAAVTAFLT